MRMCAIALSALLVAAAIALADEEKGYDPRFAVGLASDVLAEGPPPLVRHHVRDLVAWTEAAFEMAVPRDDAARLSSRLEVAWPKMPEARRRAVLALADGLGDLRTAARDGDAVRVDLGLAEFRRGLDRFLTDGGAAPPATGLADLLRMRRREAWPGDPPIHAAAAAAWLDLVECVVSLGRNEDLEPTDGQRSVVFADLGRAFGDLDAPTRRRLLEVHRPWLRLQAAWMDGTPVHRLALRFRMLRLLAGALPEAKQITLGDGNDMVAYARGATLMRTVQSGYDAWSNLARRPADVLDAVEAWLGEGRENDRPRPLLD